MIRNYLIEAAGGNGTAIRVIDEPLSRAAYATEGAALGKEMEPFGAEQAGFLVPSINHFEMGGAEFCGNAARSVAILLSEYSGKPSVQFTMSGYAGKVSATVKRLGEKTYRVRAEFPGLPIDIKEVTLADGKHVTVVDLKGIVQVLVHQQFPTNPDTYRAEHRAITKELDLTDRGAVGVTWLEQEGEVVRIHPVVWVRDVDTFFYEQACGSATIATNAVTGARSVVQPSGGLIEANREGETVILESDMEVVREY